MKEIRADSPRLVAARRFGDELTRSMTLRQVGQHNLAKAAGVARSAVVQWRHGRNLPTLATAARLSESLSNDRLLSIVREARTLNCERCGRPFLQDGAGPKKYCSERCLRVAQKLRIPVDEQSIDIAVDVAKRVSLMLEDVTISLGELEECQVSIALMCRACEPAGFCRAADCPLRPVSPLQLRLDDDKDVQLATKAPGAWKGKSRERMLAAIRAGSAARWSRPGEREAAREQMKGWHARMTEVDRQAWIQKIKDSKRAARDVEASAAIA